MAESAIVANIVFQTSRLPENEVEIANNIFQNIFWEESESIWLFYG